MGRNCPRLGLLWEAVHPICRHCTPSDRVQRDVTGAAGMRRRTTNDRGGTQAVWLRPLLLLYERGAIIAWVL